MIHEPQAARAKIDGMLELPQLLAGAKAGALTIVLIGLEGQLPTQQEYGDVQPEALSAFQTVCSALAVLRERAIEREYQP